MPEIKSKISMLDLGKWYQKIRLPDGVVTPGSDRKYVIEKVLNEDITGKSFLDVGCAERFFVFEALKRGASRAVGIDINKERIARAKSIARILGLAAEFYVADIEKLEINEKFDIVFALNLLHHLKNPIDVLNKLASITRDKLILEIASFGDHDAKKLSLSKKDAKKLLKYPVIYVGRNGSSGANVEGTYYFSPQAITNMLLFHRNDFAKVDVIPTAFKNRYLLIAHKRKIKKLTIIAGPHAVGKSYFVKELLSMKLPKQIYDVLGLMKEVKYTLLAAKNISYINKPYIENCILHYDITRPIKRGGTNYERDEALNLIECADDIAVVTLYAPAEILRQRLEERMKIRKAAAFSKRRYRSSIISIGYSAIKAIKPILPLKVRELLKKLLPFTRHYRPLRSSDEMIYRIYHNPKSVDEIYQAWYKFIRSHKKIKHIIVDNTSEPKVIKVEIT